jgi:hypothetical protein
MIVLLTTDEIGELDRQRPSTRSDGGFQGMLVDFAFRVNRRTGRLDLTPRDIERIPRYAFDYRRGGWQKRLQRIFGRSLGPSLGRRQNRRAA